jgi:type IV pilus assembly protein PilC
MARYIYRAKTKDARSVRETESAKSKSELIARLRGRGLFVIAVEEVKEGVKKHGFLFSLSHGRGKRGSLKSDDLAFFARNLSTTLSSGVTLLRSLELIAQQTESLKLDKALRGCQNDIKNGLAFGEAATKHPTVFSNLWTGVIRVGETSGNLPFVLDKLADYLEMRMEFERKIKSALVYPTILMVVALVAVAFFLKVIFPKFKNLFTQFDMELPAVTQFLFNLSTFLEDNFLIVSGFVVFVVILFVAFRKNPTIKRTWDVGSLKIPYFGKIFFVTFIERLTSTINILLESGLPLVYTLEVSARSLGNTMLENKVLFIAKKVRDGNSLSEQFRSQGIFPGLIAEMVTIGEETGSMPEIFKKVSLHYRKELTVYIERFIAAFEPIMIVLMGVMIGGIVIALFLPLFRIATLNQ